jgi:predicted DNA-binding transcriptional regulator AlpA
MRPFDNSIVPLSGTDILLTGYQLAKLTGRSRKTLQKDRVRGGGVPFIRFGRSVRYRLSDVQAWIVSQRSFTSTSEYGAADPARRGRDTRLALTAIGPAPGSEEISGQSAANPLANRDGHRCSLGYTFPRHPVGPIEAVLLDQMPGRCQPHGIPATGAS